MTLIADIILIAACIGSALYCFVLSRRLRAFNNLEGGMGGAVAVLSLQVDELQSAVKQSKSSMDTSRDQLEFLLDRAEDTHRKLEIQIASVQDVVDGSTTKSAGGASGSSDDPVQPMFVRHKVVAAQG